MKIVVIYDISTENIDLNDWNQPDILENMDRTDEPFEDVEDLLTSVAEQLNDQDMTVEELFDNFNVVASWTVQADE